MITEEQVLAAARELGFRTPESFARIRAALEAAERAAWRPIEEASKDGSRWLAKGTYGDRIIEWDLTEKKWKSVNSDEWFGNSAFDLVRPLPSPPEAPKGEE